MGLIGHLRQTVDDCIRREREARRPVADDFRLFDGAYLAAPYFQTLDQQINAALLPRAARGRHRAQHHSQFVVLPHHADKIFDPAIQ